MPIRVGLIGCGNIARSHAQGYLDNLELAGVVATCDERPELAQAMAQRFGAQTEPDWHDILNRADVDAVDVCLPHVLHAPVAIAAAQAGKHVLVEKPMASSLAEAREMAATHARTGTILMVAQHQRFVPEHRRIKELIDRGALGRVSAARADCNQYLYGAAPGGHWLFHKAVAGGGVVISVAVHKLDLLRYLIGEVRRVAAFQSITGINPGMDCEDASAAILEFENGAVGEMFSSYSARKLPIPGVGELLILYGERGVITNIGGLNVYSDAVPEYSGGMTRVDVRPENAMTNEIRHWLECIRDGREPLSSGRDNLKTMAIIDAIYRSADSGKVVDVEG